MLLYHIIYSTGHSRLYYMNVVHFSVFGLIVTKMLVKLYSAGKGAARARFSIIIFPCAMYLCARCQYLSLRNSTESCYMILTTYIYLQYRIFPIRFCITYAHFYNFYLCPILCIEHSLIVKYSSRRSDCKKRDPSRTYANEVSNKRS